MHKNNIAGNASTNKHPKFAPLTLDSTFKKAFANEESKDLLVFLLNTFLKKVLKKPICDVTIINPVKPPQNKNGRGAVLDIHCEDASGTRFIVEMQVGEQEHFIKRAIFYICMAITNIAKKGLQKHKGKKIPYDFNFPVIYTLSFLRFDLGFGKGCDEVIQYLSVRNDLHPNVCYDIMHMVYVRLSRFSKTEEECHTDIDRMLFSFKNAENLEKVPKSFKKTEFKRIFEIARISNFTQMEHMDYIRKMMAYSDSVHSLEFAKKKGLEEGMRKGKLEGKQEAAQSMLAEGLDPALVARITKLPKKQIMAMR